MENKSISLEELKLRKDKLEAEFKKVQEQLKITLVAQKELTKKAEVLTGQYLEVDNLIKTLEPAQPETPKTAEEKNVVEENKPEEEKKK